MLRTARIGVQHRYDDRGLPGEIGIGDRDRDGRADRSGGGHDNSGRASANGRVGKLVAGRAIVAEAIDIGDGENIPIGDRERSVRRSGRRAEFGTHRTRERARSGGNLVQGHGFSIAGRVVLHGDRNRAATRNVGIDDGDRHGIIDGRRTERGNARDTARGDRGRRDRLGRAIGYQRIVIGDVQRRPRFDRNDAGVRVRRRAEHGHQRSGELARYSGFGEGDGFRLARRGVGHVRGDRSERRHIGIGHGDRDRSPDGGTGCRDRSQHTTGGRVRVRHGQRPAIQRKRIGVADLQHIARSNADDASGRIGSTEDGGDRTGEVARTEGGRGKRDRFRFPGRDVRERDDDRGFAGKIGIVQRQIDWLANRARDDRDTRIGTAAQSRGIRDRCGCTARRERVLVSHEKPVPRFAEDRAVIVCTASCSERRRQDRCEGAGSCGFHQRHDLAFAGRSVHHRHRHAGLADQVTVLQLDRGGLARKGRGDRNGAGVPRLDRPRRRGGRRAAIRGEVVGVGRCQHVAVRDRERTVGTVVRRAVRGRERAHKGAGCRAFGQRQGLDLAGRSVPNGDGKVRFAREVRIRHGHGHRRSRLADENRDRPIIPAL